MTISRRTLDRSHANVENLARTVKKWVFFSSPYSSLESMVLVWIPYPPLSSAIYLESHNLYTAYCKCQTFLQFFLSYYAKLDFHFWTCLALLFFGQREFYVVNISFGLFFFRICSRGAYFSVQKHQQQWGLVSVVPTCSLRNNNELPVFQSLLYFVFIWKDLFSLESKQ